MKCKQCSDYQTAFCKTGYGICFRLFKIKTQADAVSLPIKQDNDICEFEENNGGAHEISTKTTVPQLW